MTIKRVGQWQDKSEKLTRKKRNSKIDTRLTDRGYAFVWNEEVTAGKFDYVLVLRTTNVEQDIQAIYIGDAR